jgi:hypothetical protein
MATSSGRSSSYLSNFERAVGVVHRVLRTATVIVYRVLVRCIAYRGHLALRSRIVYWRWHDS